ncbi:MAG: hypothetical protein ACK5QX_01545 [bacterium]|jgi:hypothetical protein
MKERKTIAILSLIVLAQMVFLKIPFDGNVYDLFPLSGAKCTVQEYFYYLFEHLTILCLVFMLSRELVSKEVNIFLLVFLFDLIDFLLTYNSTWFRVFGFGVSYNVVQAFIAALVLGKAILESNE